MFESDAAQFRAEQPKSEAAAENPARSDFLEQLRCAQSGDPVCQFKVGEAYIKGKVVTHNDYEGFIWMLRAAEQGYADAQCAVGRMYFMGEGTARNNEEAYFWYSLAAKRGKSQECAASVARYLKPDQIKAIEKRVVDWNPSSGREITAL